MTAIDARELKLRIVGSFSLTELRRLLDSVGVLHADVADDKTALATLLLKAGTSSIGMGELIRRLKAEKPLYEWPSIDDSDERWASPARIDRLELPDLSDAPTRVEPTPASGHGAPALTMDDAPESENPKSENPESENTTKVEAPPVSRRSASDAPPASSAPSSAKVNPLIFAPLDARPSGESKGRGIDPKILVVALGLAVALAIVAFGAGLLWRRGGPDTAGVASASAAPAPRSSGIAGHAADELDVRIVNVAALCDLGLEEGASRAVFEAAQRGCGTVEQERLRRKQRAALDAARPIHRMPDPPPEVEDDRPQPIQTPKAPGPPVASRCMTSCQRARTDCESSCGPEPKDATDYDKWQACSGGCLTNDARCRVACN